jgi:hypothetical protein
VYTGVIPGDSVKEQVEGELPQWCGTGSEYLKFGLTRLEDSDPERTENVEDVARSARMPPDLVGRIDERADSQDSSRAVVAAAAIEKGLKEDPIPRDIREPREGQTYKVALDAETAELFRRYRLENRLMPGDVFSRAIYWAGQSNPRPVPVEW